MQMLFYTVRSSVGYCSFPAYKKQKAMLALSKTAEAFSEAIPCTVFNAKNKSQLSGKMASYVVNKLQFEVSWGFVNICKSYFLFIYTSEKLQKVYMISKECIDVFRPYFPSYSACVYNIKMSVYRITVAPDPKSNMNETNKNSCMYIYAVGAFRFNGRPDRMQRICSCFKEALDTISQSGSWVIFASRLVSLNQKDKLL